jgi:hypothetical protein
MPPQYQFPAQIGFIYGSDTFMDCLPSNVDDAERRIVATVRPALLAARRDLGTALTDALHQRRTARRRSKHPEERCNNYSNAV